MYSQLQQFLSAVQMSGRSGLLAVQWLRVVLDEAHTVKNAATQQVRLTDAFAKQVAVWRVNACAVAPDDAG